MSITVKKDSMLYSVVTLCCVTVTGFYIWLSWPKDELPPHSEHVAGGDITDDAVAFSQKLIPFLQTHTLGRTHDETALARFRLVLAAALELKDKAGYSEDDEHAFISIVNEKLTDAGL